MNSVTPLPTTIPVRFSHELKDHLAAQRLFHRRSLLGKIDRVVAILLLGYGVFCVATVGVYWWTLVWFPLAVIEWFDLIGPSRLKTWYEFSHTPRFREEYFLTFTPEHIAFHTDSIDSTIQWTHYERWMETPDLFLLIYGKRGYTLVPRRAFPTPGAVDAFRALLQRKMPQ